MAKTTTKAKKATPTPTTTPDKRNLEPHEIVLSPTIQSAVAIEAWSKFAAGARRRESAQGIEAGEPAVTRIHGSLSGVSVGGPFAREFALVAGPA